MSNDIPLVSVIVSVYNTSEFLEQCLNSIVNNTFKNFEIICINDKSTDNSLNILNNYAKKDSRIRVFNNIENFGVSKTLNKGLYEAKGTYIMFVDSDDFVEVDFISVAYNKISADNSDMAMFHHSLYPKGLRTEWFDFFSISDNIKITDEDKIPLMVSGYSWAKIIKLDFIKKNNISFLAGVAYEDINFHVKCLLLSNQISIIHKRLYNYRIRYNSITNSRDLKNIDIIYSMNDIEIFLKLQPKYETYKIPFLTYKFYICYFYLQTIRSKYKPAMMKVIKKYNFYSEYLLVENLIPKKVKFFYSLLYKYNIYFIYLLMILYRKAFFGNK